MSLAAATAPARTPQGELTAYAGMLGGDPIAPEAVGQQTRFLRKFWRVLCGTAKKQT